MTGRPYVVLSAAMSLDGRLDDLSPDRLVLSDEVDLDRVDALRASCDAILVGAGTIRADDSRLLVRDPQRRAARLAAGRPEQPVRVTLTNSGELDPAAAFFTEGSGERLVFATTRSGSLARRLGERAEVIRFDSDLTHVLGLLASRRVRRLLVEGGSKVLRAFLAAGLADELHLVIAPFFVGGGPRFVDGGCYPWTADRRARLLETRSVGSVALLRIALSDRCGEA